MLDATTPDWVKHAIFYQIFPDRFARSVHLEKPNNLEPWDSDPTPFGYKGGDLYGVIEHLDYLQDLGITALYFNPIFQSASNHRYHTHDYYRVDPLLGGDEAFDDLLNECRRRGIRIVLDGVFNHASRGFFQFNDALENGASSPWVDWFSFRGFPANAYDLSRPPGYTAWYGLHALPKFNTDNPQVREFLMRVGEHWIRRGIDGWRLDVPEEIKSAGFWQEFRERIKGLNPDAYIVAEIWHPVPEALRGDQFDAVMNYPFAEAAIAFTAGRRVVPAMTEGRGYRPYPPLTGTDYGKRIDQLLGMYPWSIQLAQLNLLGSHDTARLATVVGDDVASVRLALLLLLTFPGAPSIYYGDEIGLAGGPSDALARRSFPWNEPSKWNTDLLHFTKDVIALRRSHSALRTGAYHWLSAGATTYAFARTHGESPDNGPETLVVALNVGEVPQTLTIPLLGLPVRRSQPDLLLGASATVAAYSSSEIAVQLPARSAAVLDCSLLIEKST